MSFPSLFSLGGAVLSPAAAPLLVIPIAALGWRYGRRAAWASAVAAIIALALGDSLAGISIGAAGYLTSGIAFGTVAFLGGSRTGRNKPGSPVVDPARSADEPFAGLLTKREREILSLMVEGATNAEIAARLVIAETTVQTHVRNTLRKLGARNRTDAVATYLRARI